MGPAVFAAGIRQSGFFTKSSRREEEPVIIAGKLIPVLEEPSEAAAAHAAVSHVAGMTDRYAFRSAVALTGYNPDRLPLGIDP